MPDSHEITIVILAAQCSTTHQSASAVGFQENVKGFWSSTTLREKWDKTFFWPLKSTGITKDPT